MKKCPKDRRFFEENYVRLGKSTTQISKEIGCSSSTVYRRVCKFGMIRSISEANAGNRNGMWKGDDVKRAQLHDWVRERKPKPKFCEDCGENPPKDLANISQKYRRDINDFEWLCRKCHMVKDDRIKKLIRVGGLRCGGKK